MGFSKLFKWFAWFVIGPVFLFFVLSVIVYSAQRCSPTLNQNCPSSFWEFLLSPNFKNPFSSKVENEIDETTDWQTYHNERYGFEFKYPDNYEVIIDEDTSHEDYADYTIKLINSKADVYIEVALVKSAFDIPEIQERYAPTGVVVAPEKRIYGNNTFYYYGPGGGGVAYPDQYFYNLNGKILRFIFFDQDNAKTPSAQMKQIENQILSAFKFTD